MNADLKVSGRRATTELSVVLEQCGHLALKATFPFPLPNGFSFSEQFLSWQNMHDIKFTILTIYKYTAQWH